jgi:hypothetical protein
MGVRVSNTCTQDHLGPVDFVAVEFADVRVGIAGFGLLLDLVDGATYAARIFSP